jgi:acyl-coenzyme A synthetase/AMP-(fatty) acid ligase/pimeloyl-ACP methyl ester carboxylesterase
VSRPTSGPATSPPPGLAQLDARWSRLVHVPGIDGVGRTFHVLDVHPGTDHGNRADGAADMTLLCVHGNPTWSYLFRTLVGRAPVGVRVVAVDQLDMGYSERSGRTRRLATRVDDLAALTEALGITGPVITVAHDWGGPISLGWALRHRDQLAGVVLLNTAVHQPAGSPVPALIRLARSRPLLNHVAVRTDTFVRGALRLSRPQPPAAVRAGYRSPYGTASRRHAIAAFVADIPLSPEHPSASTLDGIAAGLAELGDVPALLVWGAADPVFSDRYLHDLERRLPHADVHRHPRASHLVSEDVDAFAAVLDWVEDRRRGTADATPPAEVPTPGAPSTLVDTHAHLGDRVAIAESTGRTIDFADLADQVERSARGLAGSGVRPGDRVALMVPPGIDLAVALFACWRAGAVVVLVDSGLGPRGMSAAIASADPDHLIGIPKALAAARALRWPGRPICTTALGAARRRALGVAADLPELRRAGGELPPPPAVDDVAAVVFTSGATGPSKGVLYTHGRLEAQRDALVDRYGITHDDRLVAAFAPFALYGPAMGISSVVPDMDVAAPATLTAAALGDAVVALDATMVFASPAALANVVRTAGDLTAAHRRAFGSVRLLMSAGAPVRPALLRAAGELFPNAVARTPYGMTECLPVADIDLAGIESATGGDGVCVGHPLPGVDVRVRPLDGHGRPGGDLTDAPGIVGEVIVRAAHARAGYDRLWHTQSLASRPPGWHATGDVGHLDTSGRVWIGGRLGHVVTTAAGPVTPVRPEQAIESIPGVAAAAVVGVGPAGDQRPVAVVERDDPSRGSRLADLTLTDRAREVTGLGLVAVLEVPALPVDRRHNSKIDRTRVAAWAERALAGGRLGRP